MWPDTIVEENNLALNITVLRKALQTDGSRERFIETVSGKGYRFVAPVRVVESSEPRATPPAREAQLPFARLRIMRSAVLPSVRSRRRGISASVASAGNCRSQVGA